MKLLSPLKRHSGLRVVLTQPYGNTSNNLWYRERGIEIPFHNGLDLVLSGTPMQTYGSELVACFDGHIVKRTYESPMSTKGNGITFESDVIKESDGQYIYQAVYWHLSELAVGTNFKRGETLGYVGNSGVVFPEPKVTCVHCGSHVHFMLFVYKLIEGAWSLQNNANGVGGAIDPLYYIDDLQGEEGEQPKVARKLSPFQYFLDKIAAAIAARKGRQ